MPRNALFAIRSIWKRDEVWTVIAGEGEATVDGKTFPVREGDVIRLPIGSKHTVRAKTALKIIEVQIGRDIDVGDKVKYD